MKDACIGRARALEASKSYQEFCAQVHDLKVFLAEKLRTASDESYKDLTNLERKLQKHEAFERELRANEGQLRMVNKLGQALIAQENYRKDDVARTLHELNAEWQGLVGISLEKGRRLRQAVLQHGYNKSLEDLFGKLDEIEKNLRSTDAGKDLRSCRELLQKHEAMETELGQCRNRAEELIGQSEEMAHDLHFDADNICRGALDCKEHVQGLDEPMRRRRACLEEGLRFHKFGFEVDAELQWINEHLPLASSDALGQNLHQAQNLYKKHKKLEEEIAGHQPVINKTVEAGRSLTNSNHPESGKVCASCSAGIVSN